MPKSLWNPRTRHLLIDIETSAKSNFIINDISFGIWSRSEGFLGKVGYLVAENVKYPLFYANKIAIYRQYQEQGIYTVKPFAEIMRTMKRIIEKYSPTFKVAYNSTFDFPRIEAECKKQGIQSPLDGLIEFDLYWGACETLGQQKSFKRFIDEYGFYTEAGNRRTGAEFMYRYIRQYPEFVEEHTGYADIEIEAWILDRVIRQKKPLSFTASNQAWRICQD